VITTIRKITLSLEGDKELQRQIDSLSMLAKDKESMMTGAVIRSANQKMKQNHESKTKFFEMFVHLRRKTEP
jgi:hypothetical protein